MDVLLYQCGFGKGPCVHVLPSLAHSDTFDDQGFIGIKGVSCMQRLTGRRFLIVGNAKTGTTVISHTIMNAAGIAEYIQEPQTIDTFEQPCPPGGQVVKILFGQWLNRLDTLDAIIDGQIGPGFTGVLFILRDPRATEISALLYSPYNHFLIAPWSEEKAATFVDIFRRKEADSARIPVHSMIYALHETIARRSPHLPLGEEARLAFADQPTVPHYITTPYAEYIAQRRCPPAELLRYEDFVSGNIKDHPLAGLLSGPRDLSSDLDRTRRTGGSDDWTAFVTPLDLEIFNRAHASALTTFGYPVDVPLGGTIRPEHCSQYVARILAEARMLQAPAQ